MFTSSWYGAEVCLWGTWLCLQWACTLTSLCATELYPGAYNEQSMVEGHCLLPRLLCLAATIPFPLEVGTSAISVFCSMPCVLYAVGAETLGVLPPGALALARSRGWFIELTLEFVTLDGFVMVLTGHWCCW